MIPRLSSTGSLPTAWTRSLFSSSLASLLAQMLSGFSLGRPGLVD